MLIFSFIITVPFISGNVLLFHYSTDVVTPTFPTMAAAPISYDNLGKESSEYSEEEEEYSEEEEESSSSDDEDEPLLRYKRFAREVVNSLSQGSDGETKNVIVCMAVHPKVRRSSGDQLV